MADTPIPLFPVNTPLKWLRRFVFLEPRVVALALIMMLIAVVASAGDRFLLSSEGSGRATAYVESPKIITFDGKTRATWLDTPEEGFRIRIRSLDHTTGEWSQAWTIGEAKDNHGGPTSE